MPEWSRRFGWGVAGTVFGQVGAAPAYVLLAGRNAHEGASAP
jgi:hypothetical protein